MGTTLLLPASFTCRVLEWSGSHGRVTVRGSGVGDDTNAEEVMNPVNEVRPSIEVVDR